MRHTREHRNRAHHRTLAGSCCDGKGIRKSANESHPLRNAKTRRGLNERALMDFGSGRIAETLRATHGTDGNLRRLTADVSMRASTDFRRRRFD
jgi:hypothetical protein